MPSQDRRSPAPLNDTVRRQMSTMRRRDTKVELAVRRELHRLGLRFRVHHRGLPGTPDIVLTRARIAIFVDGCFWHRCPTHWVAPKNNADWWQAKLTGNVDRDRRKDRELEERGWTPIHVWEHENPARVATDIHALWLERTGRTARQRHAGGDS